MNYRARARDDGGWILGLIYLVVLLVGGVGWVWNIVKIVGAISEPLNAMFIARCVGVFAAPVGAILGYL